MARSGTTWIRFGAVGVFSVGLFQIGMAQCGDEMSLAPQPELPWAECGEEDEPIQIQYGQSARTCSINPGLDLDTFVFDGIEGHWVRICVHRLGTGNMDPRVEVRDPDNETIAIDSCLNDGCSVCIELTLEKTGEYRIFISEVGKSQTGNYELHIELLGFAAIAIAEAFPYGYYTTVTISPSVDQDLYKLDAVAGDLVWINAHRTGGGNMDPAIRVWNTDFTELPVDTSCDGDGCNIGVELVIEETGAHLIHLYERDTNQTGTFRLQIHRIPPLYPPVPVQIPVPVTASIDFDVDVNFFSFDGVAGTEVRITLLQTGGGLDPRLQIWDPNMVVIPEGSLACNNSGCSDSVDLVLNTTGTYLMAMWDGGTNEGGSCLIGIQCLFGNCTCAQNDSDGDGVVGAIDFLSLLAAWGPCPEPCTAGCVNDPDTCSSDVDRNCTVDAVDFLLLLAAWGNCQ